MDSKQVPGGYDVSSRPPKIKNKNPAPVQITAEQLLREIQERRDVKPKEPQQRVMDGEELDEYRQRKRKTFEDAIRFNRLKIGTWLRYAAWEQTQGELQRARSIYERALDVDPRNQTILIKYTEMEMKHRNINLARNLYDRAITILPRVDQFWYRYTYMEELLDNVHGARQIFERWMQWEPEEDAWNAYIKFELRYHEVENAEAIYERLVYVHPKPKNWISWAKFEEEQNHIDRVREIYEMAIEHLGETHIDQKIFIAFAKFECRLQEYERARVIYKYGLDVLPKNKSQGIYDQYTQFEKQYGDTDGIESVITSKRRVKYEADLKEDPKNYDVWIDYLRLEEETGNIAAIRNLYERAVAEYPPIEEKQLWRRYIYLWLFYAVFEESVARDVDRARKVYLACIQNMPHKKFTFSKLWLNYAYFEIRQLNVDTARKALGQAIGMQPKNKTFKGYIELEVQLREFDRVRKLYEKFLEFDSTNCSTWMEYANIEKLLGEIDRARALYEIAIDQEALDMPELIWKSYIDFEVEEEEYARARALYERLLESTSHVKVWVSYAQFETSVPSSGDKADTSSQTARARKVFERAYKHFKESNQKDERVLLLEAWQEFETEYGTSEQIKAVEVKLPKRVKKRRQLENGSWEEYFDYIFPDDQDQKPNLKLLNMAHQWKQKMEAMKKEKQTD
ncbi:NineTeen Complex (NTC) component [Mycoemilia scoparia]|uniref:NineTeen Complex (NTC) component n=1 Tax=Mycoemilia scoparia TaxID=417184 RepID=A0A9W8A7G9_9FUNG|nr:NineTeen Complex (NTC) component [Mycoemilia scoparia]